MTVKKMGQVKTWPIAFSIRAIYGRIGNQDKLEAYPILD
jgi:hypothetical protein